MQQKRNNISLIFLLILSVLFSRQVLRAETINVTANVVKATIDINGYTEPGSLVTIENFGVALGTTVSDANGYFAQTYTPVDPGTYEISIYAEDSLGTETNARTFTFSIQEKQVHEIHNVILPPTIYADDDAPAVGSPIVVEVHGKPGELVFLVLEGNSTSNTYTTTINSSGIGTFSINTNSLVEGEYTAYAYFDALYPSDSIVIELLPAPTATPTLTPTPTSAATPTPSKAPTTIPGRGPSATSGPEPTDASTLTVTPVVPVDPTKDGDCSFPIPKLCPYDDDKDSLIEVNGEVEDIIADFIGAFGGNAEQYDLNEDEVVDLFDLSLFLRYVSYPPATIAFFHAKPVDTGVMCLEETTSEQIDNTLVSYVFFLIAVNILLFIFGRLAYQNLFMRFVFMLLISGGLVTFTALYSYNKYAAQYNQWQNKQTSSQQSTIYKTGDEVSYNVILSSTYEPLNVFDVYISFDPKSIRVKEMRTDNSFLPIITKAEYSNNCGNIYISGGLPQQVALFRDKLLVEVTFEVVRDQADVTLNLGESSRAFSIQDEKKSEGKYPDVKLIRINK